MFLKNQVKDLDKYNITIFDDSFTEPKTIPLTPGLRYVVTYVTTNGLIKDSFKEENHVLTKKTEMGKYVGLTRDPIYGHYILIFDMSDKYHGEIKHICVENIRDIGRYIEIDDSVVITPDNSFETLVNKVESFINENIDESTLDEQIIVNVLACKEIIDLVTPIKYEPKPLPDDMCTVYIWDGSVISNAKLYDLVVGLEDNNDSDISRSYVLLTTDGFGIDGNIDILITVPSRKYLHHLTYSISTLEFTGVPFERKIIKDDEPTDEVVPPDDTSDSETV